MGVILPSADEVNRKTPWWVFQAMNVKWRGTITNVLYEAEAATKPYIDPNKRFAIRACYEAALMTREAGERVAEKFMWTRAPAVESTYREQFKYNAKVGIEIGKRHIKGEWTSLRNSQVFKDCVFAYIHNKLRR